MLLKKEEFRARLQEVLHQHVTMSHPIFAELFRPVPNWRLIRMMALQGYQLTKYFIKYIAALYFYLPLERYKKNLITNLYEEETGRLSRTKNHLLLMQDFIRSLGISDEERGSAEPLPNTKALIEYRLEKVMNPESYHEGAAAVMIASEGQNLETKAGKARHEILQKVYGLSERDVLFFSVHAREDVGHVRDGLNLVTDLCATSEQQEQALGAVRKTCELFYGMYDGVAKAYYAGK